MRIRSLYAESLAFRFMLASFPIFLISTILIGSWVGMKIESGITMRLGAVTGLYVESFVSHHVQRVAHLDALSSEDRMRLDELLSKTPLGKRIVAFKVWDRTGRVLYSQDAAIIGTIFPVEHGLKTAYEGKIHSEVSDASHSRNETRHSQSRRLIETYVPIRSEGTGQVIAVAEFYQHTDELNAEVRHSQRQSWLVVASVFSLSYLFLSGLVKQGSNTIQRQRTELHRQIDQLTSLNAQNAILHERVQRAAARTTSLNESFLRRISADLHDGPGQDLGFAVMKTETAGNAVAGDSFQQKAAVLELHDFVALRRALQSALKELRAICTGLQLPDITGLHVNNVAARAISDYQLKTGAIIDFVPLDNDIDAPVSIKIAMYRILQESLMNGLRHAEGLGQRVCLDVAGQELLLQISDKGRGFDPHAVWDNTHLGIKGMRERVELLGGSFQIRSAVGKGTIVDVKLSLNTLENAND